MNPASEISAFVLAGGHSSRMGSDKAFLQLDGRSLAEHVLALARSITPNVYLVGPRDKLSKLGPVVEDLLPGCGPLGGIHAALRTSSTDLNLVLAVDVPFIAEKFLRFLVSSAQQSDAIVTVPKSRQGWQPLCAVYRREFADIAEQALIAGRYRVDALFASVPVLAIDESELARLAFDPAMFDNLNSPEDWERAQRNLRS
ncbi:MAG: molybdenum cofactor guanylyltransferase [Candidatus Korobacteraceae bacterium]